jgi:NADH:ubiquinone oxidoreductase subunit 6 (subunit J)/NADH:ubiquinone oxidoreductase subunit K
MVLQAISFYLLAAVTLGSGLAVISARNPVHSVLFLIASFFSAAGLFVLLGAEFLAMILVVVYVGAVAVLFLFVVMMLDVDFAALRQGFARYLPIGAAIALVLTVEMVAVAASIATRGAAGASAGPVAAQPGVTNAQAIGGGALYRLHLLLPGGRPRPAGGDDRGHRPHPQAPAVHQAPGGRRPGGAHRRRRPARGSGPFRRGGRAVTIGLAHYLTVAAILFTVGVLGIFVNRKNVIVILMSIELILLAVNINLVAFSAFLHDVTGQIYALFVLTVAAAEAAVGLAILVTFFRNRGDIAVDDASMMKG